MTTNTEAIINNDAPLDQQTLIQRITHSPKMRYIASLIPMALVSAIALLNFNGDKAAAMPYVPECGPLTQALLAVDSAQIGGQNYQYMFATGETPARGDIIQAGGIDGIASIATLDNHGNYIKTPSRINEQGSSLYRSVAVTDSAYFAVGQQTISDETGAITGTAKIVRYDSNQNIVWEKNIAPDGLPFAAAHGVQLSKDGKSLYVLYDTGNEDFEVDTILASINPATGEVMSSRKIDSGANDSAEDLTLDEKGNVYALYRIWDLSGQIYDQTRVRIYSSDSLTQLNEIEIPYASGKKIIAKNNKLYILSESTTGDLPITEGGHTYGGGQNQSYLMVYDISDLTKPTTSFMSYIGSKNDADTLTNSYTYSFGLDVSDSGNIITGGFTTSDSFEKTGKVTQNEAGFVLKLTPSDNGNYTQQTFILDKSGNDAIDSLKLLSDGRIFASFNTNSQELTDGGSGARLGRLILKDQCSTETPNDKIYIPLMVKGSN
jgi:hypothetical protein